MKRFLLAAAFALAPLPALAVATNTAIVVATCPQTNIYGRVGADVPLTVDVNGNLCSSVSLTPSGTQDVNLVKVGGAAIALGQTTMSASLPVAIASNQTAIQVVGNVANGIADSGNPVKIGGVYLSSGSALTTGQRGDLLIGSFGQIVTGTLAIPADATSNLSTNITGISSGSANATATQVMPMNFNGTTWDRQRSGDVNNQAAVTGVQDALPVARYNATPPTITDTRYNALQVGSRGSLWTQIMGPDGTTPVAVSSSGADGKSNSTAGLNTYTFPSLYNGSTWDRAPGTTNGAYDIIRDAAGNARGANVNASNQLSVSVDGTNAVTQGTSPWIVAGGGTAGSAASGVVTVQGIASMTPVQVSQATAANLNATVVQGTGTNLHTVVDSGTITAVTAITNALPAGTNLLGKVGIDQTTPGTTNAVQSIPGTSGGLTNYLVEPGASDNHANIKNGAGQVYSISVFNNSATLNYIRLYNAATGFNGCNSATNIVWEGNIPASTSGAGFVYNLEPGIAFSTGISICVTSAYGQTNTTAATASAMSVNVSYK